MLECHLKTFPMHDLRVTLGAGPDHLRQWFQHGTPAIISVPFLDWEGGRGLFGKWDFFSFLSIRVTATPVVLIESCVLPPVPDFGVLSATQPCGMASCFLPAFYTLSEDLNKLF